MSKSFRSINIFVSHPFEPNNPAYDLEKFRNSIELLLAKAEMEVKKEHRDFDIEINFQFSDFLKELPQQIEEGIRKSHFAIVDITENKPNVFYEYGLQYGLKIPTLIIKAKDSFANFPIPTDIKNRFVVSYENFGNLIDLCLSDVVNTLKRLLSNEALSNIYLSKIWFPNDVQTVHVVTSTECEKRDFASPECDNYMFLESLGDKDALLEIMIFLNRNYKADSMPMYSADNFPGHHLEDNLVVIGGPGDECGDGNSVCKIMMDKMNMKVSYSEDCEKMFYRGTEYEAIKKGDKIVKDYGYFARFPNPFNPKSSVVLINGIHTFGVVGAAKVFSDHPSAQGNIREVMKKLNLDEIKQPSFECFFPVDVLQQCVVCPAIDEDYILPLD